MVRLRYALMAVLLGLAACGIADSESAEQANSREYGLHFELRLIPTTSSVEVTMKLKQRRDLLRELSFSATGLHDISGDDTLTIRNGTVRWRPPATGGTVKWRVIVQSERGGGYDAWMGSQWGLFRAEDVIPRARSRTVKGARARTTLSFRLPADWSAITEYSSRNNPILVEHADRRLALPTGWIAVGKLGVRRETIAGVRVAVAAPEGQDVRRMDILALLNWALPELVDMLPDALPRLTIVGAGDPMWRGGLSAPASLFLHASRPMISENATSTLLHEVMHTAIGLRAVPGYDWIIEGFAEYYSIELLHRGRAISNDRRETAFEDQAEWSRKARALCGRASGGPRTALAVTVLAALDKDLRQRTRGKVVLDDLLQSLVREQPRVDADVMNMHVEKLTGARSAVLEIGNLPGCEPRPNGY